MFFAIFAAEPREAQAQSGKLSFLRDAEIEDIIRQWSAPLLEAAGLPLETYRIFLVNDDRLNAFTTGGGRIYFFTGTLMSSDNPGEIIGILAHEIGHMANGDVINLRREMETAQTTSMIAAILGVAAGAATGRGDLATGIMLGGQGMALGQFFSFSRTQESTADSFAMRVLDETGQSSEGLLTFFDKLGDQELLVPERQDLWVRTHPLTLERIDALRHHVETTNANVAPPNAEQQMQHKRMVAKLHGFLKPYGLTMRLYPTSDTSLPARYARAIAYYRHNDLEEALTEIDGLLADAPDDAYFHELRGQMLFENGKIQESLSSYRKAVEKAPDQSLLYLGLVHNLVENGTAEHLQEAQTVIRRVIKQEKSNPFAWWLMANAYGKAGDLSTASYAQAERALLLGNPTEALAHADRAMQGMEKNTPLWYRLQDLRIQAETMKKE